MQPVFNFYVEDLPKLASGKTEFKRAKEMATSHLSTRITNEIINHLL